MLASLSLVIYEPASRSWRSRCCALPVLGIGLVFGLFYARAQRLWPAVLAHMMWDVIPFLA